jgi:hypothetical protein
MILLVAVILLIRLWLVFAVNVPVNVDTALMLKNFRVDLPTLAFIGLAETVVVVFLVHKWLKNNWATLGIAASPWLMTITIFHVWLGGALVGLGLVLAYKKWWSWILGLSIIYSSLFLASSSFQRLLENNLLNQITQAKLSEEVDLIQKNNFLATEKSYILPSLVRKVLYNKATLASSKIASKAVSLIDFEQGSAPLKAWVLTGMSGLPPKGVTPLVFYWEIPFIVIGGVVLFNRGVRKRYLLMFLMLALPAIIFDKKFLVVSGAGMLFFVVGLTSTGLTRVKHPLLKILIYHFFQPDYQYLVFLNYQEKTTYHQHPEHIYDFYFLNLQLNFL